MDATDRRDPGPSLEAGPPLEPAGWWRRVFGWFRPETLSVRIECADLADGAIGLEPVFLLGRARVDPALVRGPGRQAILGHAVRLDPAAADVLGATQGRPLRVGRGRAAAILEPLAARGVPIHVRDGGEPVRFRQVRPDVRVTLGPDDALLVESTLVTPDGLVIPKPTDLERLRSDDGWHGAGGDFVRLPLTGTLLDRILLEAEGDGRLEGEAVPAFLGAIAARPEALGRLARGSALETIGVFAGTPTRGVDVTGDAESIRVSPFLEYRSPTGRTYRREGPGDGGQGRRRYLRVAEGWLEVDEEAEAAYRDAARALVRSTGGGETLSGCVIPEALLRLEDAAAGRGPLGPWNVVRSRAVTEGHRLVGGPAVAEFHVGVVEAAGQALLRIEPVYRHERFQLRHDEAVAALAAGQGWVRRERAWLRIDAALVRGVEGEAQALGLPRSGRGFAFPADRRERIIGLFSTLGSIRQSAAYAEFLLRLQDFSRIEEVPLPANLRPGVTLRPYQRHGVNWLSFLQRFGLSGILADDMGLGKTLQTLAAVERAREVTGSSLPVLIVCPTSVMLNWRSEIVKFLERGRTIVWHGPSRHASLARIEEPADPVTPDGGGTWVITSFDCARIDHAILNRIPWLYVVVDESHVIKNPDAKRTQAIKTIPARHKLALTGTPIQNKLEELWSLFDFIMPGFLGTRAAFRREYTTNNRVDDAAVAGSLVPRVHPFILRRLKSTVARDLPDKIVVHREVPLTPPQVEAYRAVTHSVEYRAMTEAIDAGGMLGSDVHVFAVLAKLRNVCNHPALAERGRVAPRSALPGDSGKLDSLQELLGEIEEGDHRVLLFSQSTAMLDIIQHWLGQWGMSWLRIDGGTPALERAGLAARFNDDPTIRCFLLSTKAAGTGLNLVGADTVIFYDHDWNPANDAQAMDRAYRIGQTRNVTVYKLVSKGTLEEKILRLQAVKQDLADRVIGPDDGGFKDLSRDEILGLFALDEETDAVAE